jgi:hypothetical protein
VAQQIDPRALAADLDAVHTRIDRIAATFLDAELQERLALLRDHVSAAATTLSHYPTAGNLACAAKRLRYATQQLNLLTAWPPPKPKRRSVER